MIKDHIGVVSLLLTFVAGFTDTTTFVAADRLFSAHVTGNFVVLAYDLVVGADRSAYIKLLAFPVFVLAVMLAGRYDRRRKGSNHAGLLRLEGAMLLVAAGLVLLGQWGLAGRPGANAGVPGAIAKPQDSALLFAAQMLIITAMGFQNASNRLYAEATYGPTTVMTGNVTAAALDVVHGFMVSPQDKEKIAHFNRNLVMIGAFLLGCLCGGFSAYRFGLAVVAVPGVLVTVTAWRIGHSASRTQGIPPDAGAHGGPKAPILPQKRGNLPPEQGNP